MRSVFADTLYWYALSNPRDQWHLPAIQARAQLSDVQIVTTEEVLVELLAALSRGGAFLRQTGVEIVHTLFAEKMILVFPQTHFSFSRGLELYSNRLDKEYSLVDCISMSIMREEGITDVLTNDHHFTQEGFNVLINKP